MISRRSLSLWNQFNPQSRIGRTWLSLWQHVLNVHLTRTTSAVPMTGFGWKGVAIECDKNQASMIASIVDMVCGKLDQYLRSDLGIKSKKRCNIYVIYTPNSHQAHDIACEIAQHHPMVDLAHGFFLREYCAAMITGVPQEITFREVCVHEICHSLLNSFSGATGRIPWSFEGYASWPTLHRVALADLGDATRIHKGYFTFDTWLASWKGLRNLLSTTSYEEVLDGGGVAFYCSASLFVDFLSWKSCHSQSVAALRRRAIMEQTLPGDDQIQQVERAFGVPIKEVENAFISYCSKQTFQWPSAWAMPTTGGP